MRAGWSSGWCGNSQLGRTRRSNGCRPLAPRRRRGKTRFLNECCRRRPQATSHRRRPPRSSDQTVDEEWCAARAFALQRVSQELALRALLAVGAFNSPAASTLSTTGSIATGQVTRKQAPIAAGHLTLVPATALVFAAGAPGGGRVVARPSCCSAGKLRGPSSALHGGLKRLVCSTSCPSHWASS